jgi:restriction endonuclease S subunit
MRQLGSIAEIRMGATLRGRDATRPVLNGRYQLLRIGDISLDGELRNTKEFDRIEPSESISAALLLRKGDVLFPNRGTRNTAVVYNLDERDIIVGPQFFILRPDPGSVLPKYLAWYLRTERASNYFDRKRKGTHVQILQRSDLADLEIPLPNLSVQERIADTAELALNERTLAEKLSALKWKFVNAQLVTAAHNLTGKRAQFHNHENSQPGRD